MGIIKKLIRDYKEYVNSLPEKPELVLEPGYTSIRDYITDEKKSLFYSNFKMIVKGSPYVENNKSLQGLPLTKQWISFVRYDDKKSIGFYGYYIVYMYGKPIGIVKENQIFKNIDICKVHSVYAYYKKDRVFLKVFLSGSG